ncbi:MAG: HTH-type transcriptional regulator CymR [Firmicutes bacterium ADurb.Bin419]|nr:MAG: HTH-type transcriptional regulator CymR [Firmicutes bacterium ADurb.Bin419]
MKFSTKGRYGLRAMVDLAVHAKGEHVALFSIAERQGISTNYLEQVFSLLRKSGLVKSVKGAQGGYILAESPADIKVGRILRALEGPLSVIDENAESSGGNETNIQQCIRMCVWDKMNEALNDLADSLTLEDLVDSYWKLAGVEDSMYYI